MIVPRIEICGGIASGKTTLARVLAKGGIIPIFERFRSNPFWRDFCADPSSCSFETELTFLLQHYHSIKGGNREPARACDFSFLLDLAFADLNLTTTRRDLFKKLHDEVLEELGPPHVLVYLQCSPDAQFRRIRARGRREERSLSIDYISNIDNNLLRLVSGLGEAVRLLTVDSERENFATNSACQQKVVADVLGAYNR